MSELRLRARKYPANLWLCYRGIHYRPAALQLFVASGGWGPGYVTPVRKPPPTEEVECNSVN